MVNLSDKYRLSIYTEIVELSKGKIYIVKSSLDDKIYIKKVLEIENYDIYKQIKKLDIDNIPKVYELIKFDNKLVVIEEYINGSSLKEILNKSKILLEEEVIKYILSLIDILGKLHSSSSIIIHRDIKPSNIIINNDGVLKLIDFDISRIYKRDKSTDTIILGTHGYAAPEQFGFNQSDARSDIYSIGATMNMLLTGKLPIEEMYEGKLSKIISKCIELDSNKRFQNIVQLKKELIKTQEKHYNKSDRKIYNKESKLPGFKSGKLIFKIIGYIWYVFLIMLVLGFFDEKSISSDRKGSILLALLFLSLTFLYGNYKNIKSKLLMLNSKNIFINIFGYILYTIIMLATIGSMMPN